MTLAEIIERHEAARRPTPISDSAVVVTPFGSAIAALGRFLTAYAELDADQRASVRSFLPRELRERLATA